MSKLIIALIAGALAASAAAQTGIVNPRTIADHGTPAMHAEETKRTVEGAKGVTGLRDTNAKQQAVKDATKVAEHGTPVIHAAEARRNVAMSNGVAKPISSDKVGQEAVKDAVKGAKR